MAKTEFSTHGPWYDTQANYKIMRTRGVPVKGWLKGVPVDEKATEQLINTASMPFIYKHLAVMPDVHWGMGATIGSVVATKNAIIPAAVGVDIGCGMMACQLPFKADALPDNLNEMRSAIEAAVPHGRTDNGGGSDKGSWRGVPPKAVADAWTKNLRTELNRIVDKAPELEKKNHYNHLGTLGTGNHFIEVNLDENNNVWVMLHSGSRGIGGAIGNYYIEKAKEDMRRWFINLPDTNLAYIPEGSELFEDYWYALDWAQKFAMKNRELMMEATIGAVYKSLGHDLTGFFKPVMTIINAHHNYVSREHHFGENVLVTRKGAIRARQGDMGIIPGSMGAKSYIVRGLGNPDSFHSASHGAGRVLSRTEAKKLYTVDDLAQSMSGIESRLDADVIDEIPQAYKDIDAVMEAQKDLVEVVHTLKQVLVVKG